MSASARCPRGWWYAPPHQRVLVLQLQGDHLALVLPPPAPDQRLRSRYLLRMLVAQPDLPRSRA